MKGDARTLLLFQVQEFGSSRQIEFRRLKSTYSDIHCSTATEKIQCQQQTVAINDQISVSDLLYVYGESKNGYTYRV
jgi:hypothetical protein